MARRLRRIRQLGLSKRGDVYLRTLVMHGAGSIIAKGQRSEWVERLLARRPYNVVVAALANKLARTVWAVLAIKIALPGRAIQRICKLISATQHNHRVGKECRR